MQVLAEGVEFAYSEKSKVIDGITWTVRSGVTGLVGEKGSGKTTLLSLIVTLKQPQQGRLIVGGYDVGGVPGRRAARRLVGFVPQQYTLAGELTVADTVSYCAWVSGVRRGRCEAAAERALAAVGLDGHGRRRVGSLSADDRRLVGFAAALAHDPEILVLDGPADGLDEDRRAGLGAIVSRLAADRAVILSASDPADVAGMCADVGVLADGRMLFQGTPTGAAELWAERALRGGFGTDAGAGVPVSRAEGSDRAGAERSRGEP
ncbi:ABC-2 type transport system ATP-binding protein [Nocardiopsis mwathae]|uniref:ABC-2 type transport system ATP-binding protein n=1 Tax=Nocardiopsis mwathae TaxID=1472723 RepID=A0A7W9YFY5_9ACTN|nr:ATP-binding cassette domain-containing protein [Nocardiopsis mwathae]MBB6170791.1 ABC-2 type transport system ATP-binding protein [Nocardiopsis mwathae]